MPEITDPDLLRILNGGAPAPAPTPQRRGPVYGAPPKPEKPERLNPGAGYRWVSEPGGPVEPIPGGPADPNAKPPEVPKPPEGYRWVGEPGNAVEPIPGGPKDKEPKNDPNAVSAVRNVLDKLDTIAFDANDNKGWFETGYTGAKMRDWVGKGTAAYSLAGDIKTVDANTAFTALQKMRDNSPTGGALGQITVPELELLKSSVSNLDPDLDHATFLKNVGTSKKYYLDTLRLIDPAAAAEYDKKPGVHVDEEGRPYLLYMAEDGTQTRDYEPFLGNDDGPYDLPGTISDEGPTPPGGGSGGGGGGPSGPTPKPPPSYDMSSLLTGLGQGTGSIVEGAGSIPGMIVDPLNTSLYRALGYDNYTSDIGATLRESLGLPDNPNQTADTIIKGGALGLTGAGAARGASMLAQPGALRSALEIFGTGPGRQMVGGAAAAAGGEFARQNDVGPLGQAAASLAGGMAGYGGANALRGALTPKAATPLAEAAARQGVDLLPADAGGPVSRIVTSASRASPISATPVVKAAENNQQQLSAAASRAARSQGSVPTTDEAGQWLSDAARRYNAKTKDISTTLYRKAFEEAGPVRVPVKSGVKAIDGFLKELRAAPNTNSKAITDLTKLRADLAKGMTAEQLHALRSEISQGSFDGLLRNSKEKGRMKAVGGALTQDMLGYFDQNFMPNVSKNIRRADKYYGERVEHIDQVLQPIIGKEGFKGGEQVVESIESMARGKMGGNKRLSRLMANMTGDERGEVRSTLIDRLGRATAGQQTADGEAFSASTFLTNWNKMTPQAKATLFNDDGLRRNLDDIAKLAEGSKATQKMANHSNTAGTMQGSAVLQGGWLIAHPTSYILGAAGQYLTGKLMASPKFARWLAQAPATKDPVAINKYVDRLSVLASREPAIQQDASMLQQHLQQSISQSPVRAAAGEEEQD